MTMDPSGEGAESDPGYRRLALRDLVHGIKNFQVWWNLALYATKARFRRTVIGPMWITLSLLVWVGMLTFVNSHLFSLPVRESVPNLIVAMVFWSYIASLANEGSMALISATGYLKNLNVSPFAYIMQCMASNFITFLFNALLIPVALLIFFIDHPANGWILLLAVPGFLLLNLNLLCICSLLALVSLRYRDVPKIINNLMQVAFFVTPVFWIPPKENIPLFVEANPIYHMLEVVRAPLLFEYPNPLSWWVMCGSLVVCGAAFVAAYASCFQNLRKWA